MKRFSLLTIFLVLGVFFNNQISTESNVDKLKKLLSDKNFEYLQNVVSNIKKLSEKDFKGIADKINKLSSTLPTQIEQLTNSIQREYDTNISQLSPIIEGLKNDILAIKASTSPDQALPVLKALIDVATTNKPFDSIKNELVKNISDPKVQARFQQAYDNAKNLYQKLDAIQVKPALTKVVDILANIYDSTTDLSEIVTQLKSILPPALEQKVKRFDITKTLATVKQLKTQLAQTAKAQFGNNRTRIANLIAGIINNPNTIQPILNQLKNEAENLRILQGNIKKFGGELPIVFQQYKDAINKIPATIQAFKSFDIKNLMLYKDRALTLLKQIVAVLIENNRVIETISPIVERIADYIAKNRGIINTIQTEIKEKILLTAQEENLHRTLVDAFATLNQLLRQIGFINSGILFELKNLSF